MINLLNGHIPLIAIQLGAIETSEGIGLQFTKILDERTLDYLDDSDDMSEKADRKYWEKLGTKETVKMADSILSKIQNAFCPTAELSYNKPYMGIWENGRANNFAIFKPQKSALRLEIKFPKDSDVDKIIEESGMTYLDYDTRWGLYRLTIRNEDIAGKIDTLLLLLKKAYDYKKQ